MATKHDFRVTAKAGPWVAGQEVQPGAVLSLTEHEAEYELGLGYLIRLGASLPPPPPPAIDAADVIAATRNGASHPFTVADFAAHLDRAAPSVVNAIIFG